MSTVDSIQVGEFLQAHFDKGVTTVRLIGAGMFSQAFSFTVDQHALIFRLNPSEEDFQKDDLPSSIFPLRPSLFRVC